LGDALDGLGVQRSTSIGSSHLYLGAALESSNLAPALALYADVILQPHLTDEQFEPARQLIIEELQSLDDEPRQRVSIELKKRFYPTAGPAIWGSSMAAGPTASRRGKLPTRT
jgi:predicted Zn-dependent peptidase